MQAKYEIHHDLDDILNRFNISNRNYIPCTSIRKYGHSEHYNKLDIYNKLLDIDLAKGFFKIKTFYDYLESLELESDIVVTIVTMQNRYEPIDIAFKGVASKYSDWIKDNKNQKYVDLIGNDGFCVYKNGIKVTKFTHYNSFNILNHYLEQK
jgi:hypothetical protein